MHDRGTHSTHPCASTHLLASGSGSCGDGCSHDRGCSERSDACRHTSTHTRCVFVCLVVRGVSVCPLSPPPVRLPVRHAAVHLAFRRRGCVAHGSNDARILSLRSLSLNSLSCPSRPLPLLSVSSLFSPPSPPLSPIFSLPLLCALSLKNECTCTKCALQARTSSHATPPRC